MTLPAPDMFAFSNAPERPEIVRAGRDIDAVAAEHVVQGLLEFQHRGDIAAKGRRVERVLEALSGASPAIGSIGREQERPPVVYSFKRVARWALPVAAVIGLCTALVFLGVPGESSALAEVRKTIAAMQAPGERRYEIHAMRQADTAPGDRPDAIVDSSGDLLLIRHTPPWQKDKRSYAFCGRDAKGPWVILEGVVIRDNSERYWPPYITDGGKAFMLASVGVQLDQLPDQFTFERVANAPIDASAGGGGAKMFERIAATRKTKAGPMPTHVDLWIDPATHLVERVEYRWDVGPAGGGESGADKPGTNGRDDHGPGGPRRGDDRRPPGSDGPHGPPPDDEDDDRPPPPPDGDDPGPHHGPDGHGPGDHGPGGQGGPDDDMGGPSPPPDGRGGPGGRDGPGGPSGGPGHASPAGGKPRLIVFQRVDAPPFPAGWFDPQTHVNPSTP